MDLKSRQEYVLSPSSNCEGFFANPNLPVLPSPPTSPSPARSANSKQRSLQERTHTLNTDGDGNNKDDTNTTAKEINRKRAAMLAKIKKRIFMGPKPLLFSERNPAKDGFRKPGTPMNNRILVNQRVQRITRFQGKAYTTKWTAQNVSTKGRGIEQGEYVELGKCGGKMEDRRTREPQHERKTHRAFA